MQKLGQRLNMKYEACKSLKLFLFITSSIAIPWPWTHGDGGRKKLVNYIVAIKEKKVTQRRVIQYRKGSVSKFVNNDLFTKLLFIYLYI